MCELDLGESMYNCGIDTSSFTNEQEEHLHIISVAAMSAVTGSHMSNSFDFSISGMIDAGANVSMGPPEVATTLGEIIHPPIDDRMIGTAGGDIKLVILGWIYPEGYTGPIAMVKDATFLLLSVGQMQACGMGCEFSSHQTVCHLSTKDSWFATLEQNAINRLYFVDIRMLLLKNIVPYVKQAGDVPLSPQSIQGGHLGCLAVAKTELVVPDTSRQQHTASASVSFRVWQLHRRLMHANMKVVAVDIDAGRIINADVTAAEIRLVIGRQDCFACALAKWNRLSRCTPSGLHPLRIGQKWSIDHVGLYAVVANGGYNAEFVCVEMSVGYLVIFLVKAKTEASRVVQELNLLCKRYGHRMESVRVDFGTVEKGAEFVEACTRLNAPDVDGISVDIEFVEKGIEVIQAAPERQKQNPVERHIQHYKNLRAAIMVDQDLLPGNFWGWAGLAVAKGINSVSNSLCPDSTPLYEFEHRRTDLSRMFKHPFGQAVISTRIGQKHHGLAPKNEFGIVVSPGHPGNGTSMIYFPDRGTRYVSPRYDVRPINLGSKPQMSMAEGRGY